MIKKKEKLECALYSRQAMRTKGSLLSLLTLKLSLVLQSKNKESPWIEAHGKTIYVYKAPEAKLSSSRKSIQMQNT